MEGVVFDAVVRKEVLVACRKGELDKIKGLYELHGLPIVNVQDEITGNSVLFLSAAAGFLSLVQFLVTNGADLHKINNRGQSILTTAAANGHVNVAMFLQDQLLLDLERQTEETDEAHDKADDRAKELNATDGRAGIVQYLCEIGGDKYIRNRCRTFVPRMFPFKSSACVPYLVEHNGIEKAKATNTGYTPLHWASNNGHFAVVEYLVQQGADIHRLANCGSLAIHRAAAMGHLNVVKLLVEAGADYNKLNNNGWSPLYEAAHNGHLEVVQYLTTLADADTKGLDACSPVTKAIADVPRGSSSGNTPSR